ncbi:glycoside hydrolase family 44 protein, partial [candidate division KSB1 bacterium]|nr:glycoside hydrolase family 44 protein [candidate division KSB1 bacterium]
MKATKTCYTGLWLLISLLGSAFAQINVNFTVDYTKPMIPISPYIYGTNQLLSGKENWTVFRLGGNRMTGYNWENNASNAGNDWYHSSDNYMTHIFGITNENKPGIVVTTFHDRSLEYQAKSIITIQMAGYVSRDKKGEVSEVETAPSARWREVRARKMANFETAPDVNNDFVYMDEFVNFLVDLYGKANEEEGILGYCLDNEPALWPSTHPRIHPKKTLCTEITSKAKEFASAIKKVDPYAEILGPCLYGFAAYTDFQGATDWNTVKKGKSYSWFIDYYLDQMKIAEKDSGKRLLDVLNVHWYPEAKGDNRITEKNATTERDNKARVQAPRTLWDPTYTENSWIGQWGKSHLPLIPKLKASIDKFYPGTKMAFNEIVYGGPKHISGTIAMADVLGIFAKYGVYMASLWPLTAECENYTAAYKIYRNYNDRYSTFG